MDPGPVNGMTQPRNIAGAGTEGQGDDKMAFMNYYHLLRYETDPQLLSMYYWSIHRHWQVEKYEKCPWANFIGKHGSSSTFSTPLRMILRVVGSEVIT